LLIVLGVVFTQKKPKLRNTQKERKAKRRRTKLQMSNKTAILPQLAKPRNTVQRRRRTRRKMTTQAGLKFVLEEGNLKKA